MSFYIRKRLFHASLFVFFKRLEAAEGSAVRRRPAEQPFSPDVVAEIGTVGAESENVILFSAKNKPDRPDEFDLVRRFSELVG